MTTNCKSDPGLKRDKLFRGLQHSKLAQGECPEHNTRGDRQRVTPSSLFCCFISQSSMVQLFWGNVGSGGSGRVWGWGVWGLLLWLLLLLLWLMYWVRWWWSWCWCKEEAFHLVPPGKPDRNNLSTLNGCFHCIFLYLQLPLVPCSNTNAPPSREVTR